MWFFPHTIAPKMEAHNCSGSLCMRYHYNFPSLKLTIPSLWMNWNPSANHCLTMLMLLWMSAQISTATFQNVVESGKPSQKSIQGTISGMGCSTRTYKRDGELSRNIWPHGVNIPDQGFKMPYIHAPTYIIHYWFRRYLACERHFPQPPRLSSRV